MITGCGMGGLPTIEEYHQVVVERGPRKIMMHHGAAPDQDEIRAVIEA